MELLVDHAMSYDLICANSSKFQQLAAHSNLQNLNKFNVLSGIGSKKYKVSDKPHIMRSWFNRVLEGSLRVNGMEFLSGMNIIPSEIIPKSDEDARVIEQKIILTDES